MAVEVWAAKVGAIKFSAARIVQTFDYQRNEANKSEPKDETNKRLYLTRG